MLEERSLITADGKLYTQPEEEKLDLLNRDEFVMQILRIIDIVSAAKGSCTLAIDGKWGSGKTFVLDKLEYKLKREQDEEKASDRYLVFHYNCWQYDYYDEPLIAIVSTMIDSIKSSVNILPDEVKKNIKAVVNTMGGFIWNVFNENGKNYFKAKTGLAITAVSERFISEKNAISESEAERTIDDYKTFNMVMVETRKKLSLLAEDITLVCVVDELDRCLPSYAIKVMERLHHLFYGVKNTVTVMAVDKVQLVNTVKQIYGDNINTNEYLRKFIDYEMTLDTGIINDKFTQKYKSYISLFDANAIDGYFSVEDFCAALFEGMEIRKQEHLMERIQTVHKILYSNDTDNEQKDYSFMCFELLLLFFAQNEINHNPIQYGGDGKCSLTDRSFSRPFCDYISNIWRTTSYNVGYDQIFASVTSPMKPYICNTGRNVTIPYLLMWYIYEFFNDGVNYRGRVDVVVELDEDTYNYNKYHNYLKEFKKIENLLKIIK